jgi:hypothetical protein
MDSGVEEEADAPNGIIMITIRRAVSTASVFFMELSSFLSCGRGLCFLCSSYHPGALYARLLRREPHDIIPYMSGWLFRFPERLKQ